MAELEAELEESAWIVATVRPETMLADVAVAVHPSDKRYDGKVGKTLILPLMNREIPLIADQYPDMEIVSIGPTLEDVHTTRERLKVASLRKVWELIQNVLKKS